MRVGCDGSRSKCPIRTDANGAATADTGRWVSTETSLTPNADRAPYRPARGGAEADHRGAQAAAVVSR